MSKIKTAAKMVGDWWAARLTVTHSDKREAFGAAVANLVERALRGSIAWEWRQEEREYGKVSFMVQVPGDGKKLDHLNTEFDYDPDELLGDALQQVFGPALKVYELQNFLPRKHSLTILLDKMLLEPKEGYGNWMAGIPIPKS